MNQELYTICIDSEDSPIKLTVNRMTKALLDHIDGNKNLEEITGTFNRNNNLQLTPSDMVNIFNKQLLGYGILEGDNTEKIKIKDKYIFLRFTVLPKNIIHKITPALTFLFGKKTFVVLFLLSFTFLMVSYLLHLNVAEFYRLTDGKSFFIYLAVIYGSLILHEFGHAAACDRFGAKSGDIGFGFYILTPVFYADITDVWRLKRNERIIVDLAGIYIQLLLCCGLAIIYYFTNSPLYLYISFTVGLSFIVNINPFLRFDGYWALSDLLMIPNLKDRSVYAANFFFGKVIGKNKKPLPAGATNIFLIVYGILRIAMIFLFIAWMVVFNHHSVLYFPVNLFDFLQGIFSESEPVTFMYIKDGLLNLSIPFIFYFLLGRLLFNSVKRKLKANKSTINA